MYTQKEIDKALQLYEQLHSLRKVIKVLGYPSKDILRGWVKQKRLTGQAFPKNKWNLKNIEQQRKVAVLSFIKHNHNIALTLKDLGYKVSSATLYRWMNENFPELKTRIKPIEHKEPIEYSLELKTKAIQAMRQKERSVISISREFGVSRKTLYDWDKEMASSFGDVPMIRKRSRSPYRTKSTEQDSNEELTHALKKVEDLEKLVTDLALESEALQKEIYQLKLQKDVLVKTAEILKKDEGVNPNSLSNREKTIVIDALRNQYKLRDLLTSFGLSKSSYFYQKGSLSKPDKYFALKQLIKSAFLENRKCYGYRRIHTVLKRAGVVASEKVIRRIMKSENLFVYMPKARKYSSYKGEISPEVPNVLNRNFHADAPNEKWLTDISEFSIPAGKVYLSPIIDCLDGMPVSWTVSEHPDEKLANDMLLQALVQLKPNEHPIIHSDRGGHYRWPRWIELVENAGLQRSMSKKGCSADNSACEGFFGRMKNEMFYGRSWDGVSIDELINQINDYMHWYAEKRIKQSLGGLSPAEYRRYNGFT